MPPPITPAPTPIVKDDSGFESVNERGIGSGSGSSPFRHIEVRRSVVPRVTGVALSRISPSYRYYEPPQVTLEQQAIMFIEAQLGEPLREDGPALGVEFDPLPSGAFGAPIDTPVAPQNQRGPVYDFNLYERSDAKLIKISSVVARNIHVFPEPWHFGWKTWCLYVYCWCTR